MHDIGNHICIYPNIKGIGEIVFQERNSRLGLGNAEPKTFYVRSSVPVLSSPTEKLSPKCERTAKLLDWLKDCRVWSISLFSYLLFVTIKRNIHVYLQLLANFVRHFPSGWLVGLIHSQPTETGFETGKFWLHPLINWGISKYLFFVINILLHLLFRQCLLSFFFFN